jgi:hypothetical protein
LSNISGSVNSLREDLTSGIQETKNLHHQSELNIQLSLGGVLVHTQKIESIQKSLADRNDTSSEELERWRAQFRSSIEVLYDCSKTQLDILLKNERTVAQSSPALPGVALSQMAMATVQIFSSVVSDRGRCFSYLTTGSLSPEELRTSISPVHHPSCRRALNVILLRGCLGSSL